MSEVTNGAKSLIKSKTAWVNMILFIVAVVNLLQGSEMIPLAAMGWLFLIAAVCNLALRFFTDQGVKIN